MQRVGFDVFKCCGERNKTRTGKKNCYEMNDKSKDAVRKCMKKEVDKVISRCSEACCSWWLMNKKHCMRWLHCHQTKKETPQVAAVHLRELIWGIPFFNAEIIYFISLSGRSFFGPARPKLTIEDNIIGPLSNYFHYVPLSRPSF